MVKIILFDAANTLIHKPSLWIKIITVLKKHGYNIPEDELMQKHKLLSEIINFPDRTSVDFYNEFNSNLLLILGIIPEQNIIDDLFIACSYLQWIAYEDCTFLKEIKVRKMVISNFNSTLVEILNDTIGKNIFEEIIVSEIEECRKPSSAFYKKAIEKSGVKPEEILYIGDSLKLDVIPANKLGITTLLIDRENIFPHTKNKIKNFKEITSYL